MAQFTPEENLYEWLDELKIYISEHRWDDARELLNRITGRLKELESPDVDISQISYDSGIYRSGS